MKAFITATGTDIGKTFVTCLLLRGLAGAIGLKPVVSGFDAAFGVESDPGRMLLAGQRRVDPASIDAIAPFRFAAPLSPDMAAAAEGRAINYAALLEFCRTALTEADGSVLVEGIGGVMVPLDPSHTVLDWMADLGLPVIVVAGSYLGTLSHTLTALAVLRARGLRVTATVINETPGSQVDLVATAEVVSLHGRVETICLPRNPSPAAADALVMRIVRATD